MNTLKDSRGYHALVQVIYELQQDGQYSDEEGEETNALIDLLRSIEAAPSPTEQAKAGKVEAKEKLDALFGDRKHEPGTLRIGTPTFEEDLRPAPTGGAQAGDAP